MEVSRIGTDKPRLIQRQVYLPDYVIDRLEQEASSRRMSFAALAREILGAEAKRCVWGNDG